MTREETARVLAMLYCYYTDRRHIDPDDMVDAWHAILEPYEFQTVREAVARFARNDKREYPSFPTPALIINGVARQDESDRKKLSGVIVHLVNNRPYEKLTPPQRTVITEADYNEILTTWEPWDMINKRDDLIREINRRRYR